MAPTPRIHVPPELLELIIDATSEDRHQCLCDCLLVSNAFFHIVRARLFREVNIHPADVEQTTSLRNFLEIGRGSETTGTRYPCPSLLVKSVTIHWPYFAFDYPRCSAETCPGRLKNWDDVLTILSLLAESGMLRSLFMMFGFMTPFHKFKAVTPAYDTIRRIIFHPAFDTLKLANLKDVPYDFLNIWNLKDLHLLQDCSLTSIDERTVVDQLPHLRTLACTLNYPCYFPFKPLHGCSPFSSIHTFVLKYNFFSFQHEPGYNDTNPSHVLSSVFKSLPSLRILHIACDTHSPYYFDSYTLSALMSLKELRITVDGNDPHDDTDPMDPGPGAPHLWCWFDATKNVVKNLRALGPGSDSESHTYSVPPSLERIAVFFSLRVDNTLDFHFRNAQDWQDLGDTLTEPWFEQVERKEVALVMVKIGENGSEILTEGMIDGEVPFLREFPKVWRERYPGIAISTTEAEGFRDDLLGVDRIY